MAIFCRSSDVSVAHSPLYRRHPDPCRVQSCDKCSPAAMAARFDACLCVDRFESEAQAGIAEVTAIDTSERRLRDSLHSLYEVDDLNLTMRVARGV